MNKAILINKLSAQMGLTSRTLRHWESEGLFQSDREIDSGWRTYDNNAVLRIKITALLRAYEIPLKEIKQVVEQQTFESLYAVIGKQLCVLKMQQSENLLTKNQLENFLLLLRKQNYQVINDESISQISSFLKLTHNLQEEDKTMSNVKENNLKVRFITLPAMRMVYHVAVSVSPEDEAMAPVIDFIRSKNLMGTARLFGGNMKPLPSTPGKPYGYGMCASIPDEVVIPPNLGEMSLPEGVYAMIESSDDIGASWKKLMNYLSQNDKYKANHSELCLEEHIRNDNPDGCGNEYYLNLLQPVMLRR